MPQRRLRGALLDTSSGFPYDARRMRTEPTQPEVLRTALHSAHMAAGARMVPFGGWEMPVQYQGIIAEHQAVRTSVGLFDLSHMGRLYFRGDDGRDLLQRISTNNVERLAPGRAQYNLICNELGGVLDDTVAYSLGDEYLLVVNAGNRLKILAWLEQHQAGDSRADLHDATFETAMIGVQGPDAEALLQPVTGIDLAGLRYYAAELIADEVVLRPPGRQALDVVG
jgi:aminomethyltransferase